MTLTTYSLSLCPCLPKEMLSNPANLNSFWAFLIIEELIRQGIDYFILSPGSRCTPLTVAVAQQAKIRKILCYDERGAGFHALGYAKATGKPAILICTSGTAAAHYYPAVIEAALCHVPMIILSSDRPPELQQTGANQTIQQDNLYGNYAQWHFNLPCPDEKILPQMVLSIIDQAVYQSTRGVVHLNCAFRDPLAPIPIPISSDYLNTVTPWLKSSQAYQQYSPTINLPNLVEQQKIIEILSQTQRGLFVIGYLSPATDPTPLLNLIQQLNWPVFADIQSQFRLKATLPQLIPYFDQLLLADNFPDTYPVDTLLQIGDRLTSKRFYQWCQNAHLKHHIVVTPYPERHDPEYTVSWKIEADIPSFCQVISSQLSPKPSLKNYQFLCQQCQKIDESLDTFFLKEEQLNEPAIARLISAYLPPDNGLFLSSSMPIRDMDMYGKGRKDKIVIAANRGASGIEGIIATAAGFAVGLKSPVTLLIGDLAFLHDLNSLSLLNSLDRPITIVLINNNGGGIFSFLPIATFPEVFEPYFGTPHHLDFTAVANLFKINYYQPLTLTEFTRVYQEAVSFPKSTLIEIKTQRQENYQLHQNWQTYAQQQLRNSRFIL